MLWIVLLFTVAGLAIGTAVLWVAWYSGRARLDIMTFLYLPIYCLFFTIPLVLGLIVSIAELVASPRTLWRNTVGAKIAMGSVALFFSGWFAGVVVGLIFKLAMGWKEGPTPKPLIIDPNPKP